LPRVLLKYFAYIADVVKKREEFINLPEDATVEDLLKKIAEIHGEKLQDYLYPKPKRELNPILNFLINKVNIKDLNGLSTLLTEADEFVIIPPVGGG